jgi:hypothetical protein
MPTADLGTEGRYLMPSHERQVFNSLASSGVTRLSDVTTTGSGTFQGLITGNDDIMVFRGLEERASTLVLQPRGGGAPVEIEKDAVRKWLFGADVARWTPFGKDGMSCFPT